ncbi:efflux RND transporter periplasmic adaptor subunit [Brevibacillus fulvus]|uniref:Multidrug efflux pump subunit AcrA (Membrane-fusion protein) n=1 Tax=Brevibacillus fulvus TaxID=1125967 RepID=A0A938Y4T9_9BACL|nr:efflux RND transporter periplasmic adaptor subunit [Brevibacillus fulvus]MBM7591250.1 multidrug efflux pump subunit AcrA (membrane-fusion protein) [Brevibacillus fulvus]
MKKRNITIILSALLLLAGCSSKEAAEPQPAQQEETVTPVIVDTVKKGAVNLEAGFTAKLAPFQEVQVSSKVSGKITSLPVKLGQYVNKGQVLFQLDKQDLENSVRQAEAALQVSRANLQQSGNSSTSGLEQAKNSLRQAEQALADAKRDQQRMQQLFSQGAISAQQMEQANTALTNAQTAYDNAKQTLQSAQQMSSVVVSEASVKQAEVSLQNAREQLANATVTAPISGFIASVDGEVGQMASAQTPVVTVVNTNPLLVKANLSENDIRNVKVGTVAKVTIPSYDQTIDAKVTAVSPVMDEQLKAYPVEISIPNPNNELKPDLVVNVVFQTGSGDDKLVISRAAVVESGGKQYVYKVEGDTAKQVEVTTGQSSSDYIEIVSGLAEGDQIVVKGQTMLKDGSKISIAKSETESK